MNNYEDKHQDLSKCPRCGESGIEHLISYSHCLNCGYSSYGSHDKCLEHAYFEAIQLEKELDELIPEEEITSPAQPIKKEAI